MWEFAFFRYAIIISFVLSFLFALISFLIVTRKLSFLAIGTEHAAFGGMGLAHVFGWDPFTTTTIFCTTLTVLAGRSQFRESNISIFFSGAMALGMILFTINPNSSFNLSGFLFGNIVGITQHDLIISSLLTFLIAVFIIPALGKILFISFDRDTAIVFGVPVNFWDTVVYASLSVSIILGIKLVGVLLVASMTVLPSMFALLWKQNTHKTLIIAFFYSLFSMLSGILISTLWDVPPGAIIVLISVFGFFIVKKYLKIKE